ncbi:MAG: hypothetical protein P4L51_26565 [Puia sp.]|nr:hypothetical protein [Puia sp.]
MYLFKSLPILGLCFASPGLTTPGFRTAGPAKGSLNMPEKKEEITWIVQKSSSLLIAGHTNLSHFSCGVPGYEEPDTLILEGETPGGITLRGSLRIDIGSFDCRNRLMTGELRKALKYAQYPLLTIAFINLEQMPLFNDRLQSVRGGVDVGLAGVCRQFEIDYTSRRIDVTTVELEGCRAFSFSDFRIQPPRKMGGLIRVDDSLQVRFTLFLKRA